MVQKGLWWFYLLGINECTSQTLCHSIRDQKKSAPTWSTSPFSSSNSIY
jgi:hypothetical protein